MPREMPLVTTLAAALTSAWLLGVVARKAGLSPIVGYLLAGVVIGPHTPESERIRRELAGEAWRERGGGA